MVDAAPAIACRQRSSGEDERILIPHALQPAAGALRLPLRLCGHLSSHVAAAVLDGFRHILRTLTDGVGRILDRIGHLAHLAVFLLGLL
jgi:hypothetical protein